MTPTSENGANTSFPESLSLATINDWVAAPNNSANPKPSVIKCWSSERNEPGAILLVIVTPHLAHWLETVMLVVNVVIPFILMM